MTRKEALTTLLGKVKANTLGYNDADIIIAAFDDVFNGRTLTVATIVEPHLNGIKALHEAVLPGWEWGVTNNAEQPNGPAAFVAEWADYENGFEATDSDPARAWFISIIKALIAQEESA